MALQRLLFYAKSVSNSKSLLGCAGGGLELRLLRTLGAGLRLLRHLTMLKQHCPACLGSWDSSWVIWQSSGGRVGMDILGSGYCHAAAFCSSPGTQQRRGFEATSSVLESKCWALGREIATVSNKKLMRGYSAKHLFLMLKTCSFKVTRKRHLNGFSLP